VFAPWGTPIAILTPGGEAHPTLTADMLELYFDANRNIYVMTRATTTDPWGTPTLVAPLSFGFNNQSPEVTSDGLTMFLASKLASSATAEDIYMATRADRSSAWGVPVIVSELSSSDSDSGSAPSDDLLTIVMNRLINSQSDLFISTRVTTADPWGAPVAIGELDSALDDTSAMLTPDKLTVYFGSTIGGGGDLYIATRPTVNDTFSAPSPITELDVDYVYDGEPWLSPDGHDIYFTSGRSGTFGIYHATR
jgi:hypothetical protein